MEDNIKMDVREIGYNYVDRINPLKHEVHKNNILKQFSFYPKERRKLVCITEINWLMLFREIIAVYSEEHIDTLCGQNAELLNLRTGVTYSCHDALKG
jgi:hypothetical protein